MIYTEASQAIQTELGANLWSEDYSYSPTVSSSCSERFCRVPRGRMMWVDSEGNIVERFHDEAGGTHIRVVPTWKKPYKPVRGIRMPRMGHA